MCKIILLLTLPLLSFALSDITVLKRDFDNFLASDNSPQCQAEFNRYHRCYANIEAKTTEIAQKGFQVPSKAELTLMINDMKKASACVGEVTCNKFILAQYINVGSTYFVENAISKPYDCLAESDFLITAFGCVSKSVPHSLLKSIPENPMVIAPYIKPIIKCTATQVRGCSVNQKNSLYRGGMAFADVGAVIFDVLQASSTKTLPLYASIFNTKFNPAAYDTIVLQ